VSRCRVRWLSLNRDSPPRGAHWDQTLLEDLLGDEGWQTGVRYEHDDCACGRHFDRYGGIVVVPGQHNAEIKATREDVGMLDAAEFRFPTASRIADVIEQMDWALVIVTSDEEGLFPLSMLPEGPRYEVWTQYRDRPEAARILPIGYPPGLRNWARRRARMTGTHAEAQSPLFFAGQDNTRRRHELLKTLEAFDLPGMSYLATDGFTQGMGQQNYWAAMLGARMLPAPSGHVSVDSFRLYEALELGRIPVIERKTDTEDMMGTWERMFGANPLPIVSSWEELPELQSELGRKWAFTASRLSAWWQWQKRELAWALAETTQRLREAA
jgi:hypothetical protein